MLSFLKKIGLLFYFSEYAVYFAYLPSGKKVEKTQNAQVRERLLLYLTSPGHDFFFCLVTCATFLPSPPAAPTALTRRPLSLSRLILSSSEDANPIPENLGSAFLPLRGAFAESSGDDSDLQPSTTSLETQTLKGSSPHPNYFQSLRKTCLLSLAAHNLAVKSISNIFRIFSLQKPN